MTLKTVYELFREQALARPGEPAVLAPGKKTASFGELLRLVDGTRGALHSQGVDPGSRVGILVPQRAQTAVAHLATMSTCISVPLNSAMTPDELSAAVSDLRLSALLIGDGVSGQLHARARLLGVQLLEADDRSDTAGFFAIAGTHTAATTVPPLPSLDDVAVLMQTSGTTAKQKTVPRTHANQAAQLTGFSKALGMTPSDLCMNLMPIYHTTGIGSEFLAPIITGASVVFVDLNPVTFEASVNEYRPAWFNLVPSMHQSVLARLEGRRDVFKDSSVRFTRSSSAKVSQALRRQIEEKYGLPLVDSYGSTETGSITFTGIRPGDYKEGSVGRPAHDGVVVMDESGDPVSAGERGEVCVTGGTVMNGYEDNPGANAEAFRNGYYRTGDEAYIDEDGFLFITGRLRETVNRGGEKFSLAEVDEALLKIEGVAQAAAFSAPHLQLGQEVYAAAVPGAGRVLTPAQVRARLAELLSWAKVPKRVFVVDELPLSATGKVLRSELVKLVEE